LLSNTSKVGGSIDKENREKRKKKMQEELLALEQLEEETPLIQDQMLRKSWLISELLKISEEEELYWKQRSHDKLLHEGDLNTEYFHRMANGRKRRNLIIRMEDGDKTIEGDADLLAHATDYYKNLFGPDLGNSFPLDPALWEEEDKVDEAENNTLCPPFSEEEIKYALFQMEKNKAAGPDKIPIEFYQSCWDIIKSDIIELFDDFHKGNLPVNRLNYGVITLLPKVQDAAKIQQFRPICLLNCLYKWITKTLTLRIEKLADKLILKTQSSFLKGRNIMNGVMALHEILHETKRNKEVGVVLKLDFEKAYDKVNWNFLFDCLHLWGFCDTWVNWIKAVVTGGIVCVKLNNVEGPYFISHKGVRQGDPLSPILFNFVADCLARMVRRAHTQWPALWLS